ncbi:MAG: phosphoribosylanthranilate isomerase [Hyphomicrobiales bacterium]
MTVKVKICGIRTPEALDAALDSGAQWFGLVFYPRSPRNVTLETARALVARARGRIPAVALLVDPGDAQIEDVVSTVAPQWLQLHGDETPERVAEIRKRFGLPVIKAIRVAGEAEAKQAIAYDGIADMVLFDALPPGDDAAALPGGNGVPFDWRALRNMTRAKRHFILSGGLTPGNVQAAIAATGAETVDVSSGVESAPGVKDPARIRAFIRAAQGAVAAV